MANRQTAVQWLYGVFQLYAKGKREAPNWWDLERAIHMEKEEIMDAYAQGVVDEAGEILDVTNEATEYYEKTYRN